MVDIDSILSLFNLPPARNCNFPLMDWRAPEFCLRVKRGVDRELRLYWDEDGEGRLVFSVGVWRSERGDRSDRGDRSERGDRGSTNTQTPIPTPSPIDWFPLECGSNGNVVQISAAELAVVAATFLKAWRVLDEYKRQQKKSGGGKAGIDRSGFEGSSRIVGNQKKEKSE